MGEDFQDKRKTGKERERGNDGREVTNIVGSVSQGSEEEGVEEREGVTSQGFRGVIVGGSYSERDKRCSEGLG